MAARFQLSATSISAKAAVLACIFAAAYVFGALDTARGAFLGSMAGALFGVAIGIAKHGIVSGGCINDDSKRGTFIGAIVGSWALQFHTLFLATTIIALAVIATIIAEIVTTIRGR